MSKRKGNVAQVIPLNLRKWVTRGVRLSITFNTLTIAPDFQNP